MLACPQDLYFHSDATAMNANFQAALHDSIMQSGTTSLSKCQHKDGNLRQVRSDSMLSSTDMEQMSNMALANNNIKDKEEQVWPPDVESAFIEALESIPKLGRRKILVNGKPCGRNELISDFIYRKTSKIRTRKQVSSHIQVLKNTRKGDAHFMRLLTDSSENEENANSESKHSNASNNNNSSSNSTTTCTSKIKRQHHPYHRPHFNRMHHHHAHFPHHHTPKTPVGGAVQMKNYQSVDSLSSDDSSINSSPSPTDYMLDMMYGDPAQQQLFNMLQFKDLYDPMQLTSPDDALGLLGNDPFFGSDLITPLLNEDETDILSTNQPITDELLLSSLNMIKTKCTRSNKSKSVPNRFSLWPNYLCLYLEYALPHDPCGRVSHNLSQLPHCYANCLSKTTVDSLPKEKCPPVLEYIQKTKDVPLLLAKTKLDLNLNIANFSFNNTSFFEAQSRRTIECTTTIYSFGNVVLESKEVQQALWVNEGKYMYNFVFVNQFFDAFMKGIRSLKSWEEVDIAVNNLCIVQSFEDIETKYMPGTTNEESNTPLLVMIYEFERGDATIDVSIVGDDDDEEKVELDIENELEFLDDSTLNN